jgi:hypothetical protein
MVGSTGIDGTPLLMVAAAIVATDVMGNITVRSGASGCRESGGGVGGGYGEGTSGGESSWIGEDGDSDIVCDSDEVSDCGRSGDEVGMDGEGSKGVDGGSSGERDRDW